MEYQNKILGLKEELDDQVLSWNTRIKTIED